VSRGTSFGSERFGVTRGVRDGVGREVTLTTKGS
jgi:hypothetical protein